MRYFWKNHGCRILNKLVKILHETGRIRTQSLSQTSKGKIDKITDDKPSKQLFPKQLATVTFTELNKLDTQKC